MVRSSRAPCRNPRAAATTFRTAARVFVPAVLDIDVCYAGRMTLLALLVAAQAANVPELPKDIPQDAVKYTVLLMGLPAGQQALWAEGGKLRAFFQFNDRGRGPKTYSTLALQDGVPVSEQIEGNDYMKD